MATIMKATTTVIKCHFLAGAAQPLNACRKNERGKEPFPESRPSDSSAVGREAQDSPGKAPPHSTRSANPWEKPGDKASFPFVSKKLGDGKAGRRATQ
jgi:hypothetical protein